MRNKGFTLVKYVQQTKSREAMTEWSKNTEHVWRGQESLLERVALGNYNPARSRRQPGNEKR